MAVTVTSLDNLISQLHRAFEGDSIDVDHIKELMKTYKSNQDDWGKFAIWDKSSKYVSIVLNYIA